LIPTGAGDESSDDKDEESDDKARAHMASE
jgi:hypothetical protein